MVFSGGLEEGFGAGAPGVGTAGIDGADGAFEVQGWESTDFGANGPLDYIKIYKKPIGAGVAGLLLVGILASSLGGDGPPPPPPAAVPPAPSPSAAPPSPDTHIACVGSWLACDADCSQVYRVVVQGDGCEAGDVETRACSPGEGECPSSSAAPPPAPPPSRHKPPPSPEAVAASDRVNLEVDAGLADGFVSDEHPLGIYSFPAVAGQTYLIETELPRGSPMDSTLRLYGMDGTTLIDFNDDDTRDASGNALDSFIEWSCPVSGVYYLEVACNCEPSVEPMTFQIGVSTQAGNDPCDSSGPGAAMGEVSATIVFQPDGNYEDDAQCTWVITCPNGWLPVFTFDMLDTELSYDYVTLYDGEGREDVVLGRLSGAPADVASTPYSASDSTLTVQFTSDESIGAEGFSGRYNCEAHHAGAPPPPPAVVSPPPPAPPACDAHPCVHGTGGEDGHGCTNLHDVPVCFDTCLTHNDNECDDGGIGSLYNVCELGSDCADCSPRSGFTCNCEDGYEGITCDRLSDPCSAVHCVNGGVCETQCFLGLCAASCSCPNGFQGESCEQTVAQIAATPVILGSAMDGQVGAPMQQVYFSLQAQEGTSYVFDTEAGTLTDTVMVLYGLDGVTLLAENDDDTTHSGNLDSYIEWTCPASGSYTVMVHGFANSVGTFTLTVSEAMSGPCSEHGSTLLEPALEIAYQPTGGTLDNQVCSWSIMCRPGQLVTLTLEEFETEQGYDTLTLSHMGSVPQQELTGLLADLPATSFDSATNTMTLTFTSDESVGAQGFRGNYVCHAPASTTTPSPGPPPPELGQGDSAGSKREVVRPITTNGFPAEGHVMAPGQEIWFSFSATAGTAYQMETNTAYPYGDGVLDSTMRICDAHPCEGPPLAENDDDTRATADAGTLESYLEWTAPPCPDGQNTCTYYLVVAGYGQSVGTFAAILSEMVDACNIDPTTGAGGLVLSASSATISFAPQGDMANHPGHMMCDWSIRCPDPSTHVRLTFDAFQLNPSPSSGDHVALFDGMDDTAHKFRPNGQITGTLDSLPQATWESSGSNLLIQFTSDETAPAQGEGFEAYYDCVPAGPLNYVDSTAPCETAAGVLLNAQSATVSFRPQARSDHPGHMMCDWVITCPDPGTRVQFTFDAFQLNPSQSSGDHVALYDGPDESAHKFLPNGQGTGLLGDMPQTSWTSSGQSLLMQFTSDETAPAPGEGFEAHYDCV